MIKRIKIIYRSLAFWTKGGTYESPPIAPYEEGEVLFYKEYPKGKPTAEIWNDIRNSMFKHFFALFFSSVVWRTPISKNPQGNWDQVTTPDNLTAFISKGLNKKMNDQPEAYVWNKRMKKWHLTDTEYISRTISGGGEIQIGISNNLEQYPQDYNYLDLMQQYADKGDMPKNVSLFLFVYPDKYDEEIRSMFQLDVEFW